MTMLANAQVDMRHGYCSVGALHAGERCRYSSMQRPMKLLESQMTAFRAYLVFVLCGLAGYTLVVGVNHGWDLVPIFFSNIATMDWSGQFNLDFMGFLGLSAIWVAWRHRFSGGGLALGAVAFVGGMMFLAPYLLWAGAQARGDAKILLLGKQRAAG
jgi:hypothetical protein